MRTWQLELAAVAFALAIVVIVTGNHATEWLGALGVTLSFAHGQVADRLAEKEAARERPEVECHAMAVRYFVAKEAAWCAYFVLHRSWSALVGVALFLAYPAWRRWYRRRA